jgi:hypothetical protein
LSRLVNGECCKQAKSLISGADCDCDVMAQLSETLKEGEKKNAENR